nr:transglycosylase domain-containing protein [Aestuariimicrobium ganziense]
MSHPPKASKLYALTMFLVVSVLCGLLTAGLAVPFVAMAGGTAKAGSESLEELPAALDIPPQAEKSVILMADGSELGRFFDQNRIYVPLDKIHPNMRIAQVVIEDHRFYEHGAIDLQGTLRALLRNSAGGQTQGGSTLTQQYVKQVLVQTAWANDDAEGMAKAQEESYTRKIRELRYAIALEKKYSKDEILERYLNIAYYGDGAYGVEAAARHYFNTTAAKLNLAQASMLAGLVQNPTATNPRLHPEAAMQRRNVVINRIAELGIITPDAAERVKKAGFDTSKIQPEPNGCTYSEFPQICDYVRRTLVGPQMTSLGKTTEERESRLKRGGLTIQTLIDPRTQRAAEKAIAKMVAPTDPVIATSVLLEPKTGLIVAMAQSRPKMGKQPGQTYLNYNVEKSMGDAMGFQAGSTFKAFTVAAALEKGLTPKTRIRATSPMQFKGETFSNCEGSFVFPSDYKVSNSVRGYDNRDISLVEAAQGSVNTYFVQLEQRVGICETTRMAAKVGAKIATGEKMESQASNPSFTLGTVEVTPLSMAEAYATFANRGVHCTPLILQSVVNKAGAKLAVPANKCAKAIEPQIADGTNYVLSKVMERPGTGARVALSGDFDQAGKTGTTESNEAVWFAGYTPEMAGVAMISIDKGNPYWEGKRKSLKQIRLPSGTWLEGSGSGDAGQIWNAAMTEALKGKKHTRFVAPTEEILEGKKKQVPSTSGMGYDEAKRTIEAAGFSTSPMRVYSNWPQGYYLGATPQGMQPLGTTIYLRISAGPAPRPKPKPDPKPDPTATTEPSNTKEPPKPTATSETTKPKPGKKP